MPRTALLVLLLVPVLAGCGSSAAPPVAGAPAAAREPAVAPVNAPKLVEADPVATRTTTVQDERVSLALLPVRRRGRTATVSFVLTTKVEEPFDLYTSFDDGALQRVSTPGRLDARTVDTSDGISIVDTGNAKRYLVARDGEGVCVCTRDLATVELDAGTPARISATFGAPPPATRVVDVDIPLYGTFADVPIV